MTGKQLIADVHEDAVRTAIQQEFDSSEWAEVALDTGDYLVTVGSKTRIIVERKTTTDFISSFLDGRLFQQRERIARYYAARFFLIEGNIHSMLTTLDKRDREKIYRFAASTPTKYDINVVWTFDIAHTVQFLRYLYDKVDEIPVPAPIYIPKKKTSEGQVAWMAYPGISEKLSENLYEKTSVLDVANLILTIGEDEARKWLMDIDGIGKAKAEAILRTMKDKRR